MFQEQLLLKAGQKYCRMLHSAVLLTFIKLPFVIKTFVYFLVAILHCTVIVLIIFLHKKPCHMLLIVMF